MMTFFRTLGRIKKMNSCLILRTICYQPFFSYAIHAKGIEELPGLGMKNSMTLASPGNIYFNSFRDENI